MRKQNKFWKEIEKDDKEIEKINKIIDRKDTKELDRWTKRWLKEGDFWKKEKFNKNDWF